MKNPSSKNKTHSLHSTHHSPILNNNINKANTTNLSDLRQDPDLGYWIRVLLYDLNNVKTGPSSTRLSTTTHPLYISGPYFREHEASKILTAAVPIINDDDDDDDNDDDNSNISPITTSTAVQTQQTIEQALHSRLSTFLDKRRASGDARPCGPHDMVPIYSCVFGITKEELGDERFLGRLQRCGVGGSSQKAGIEAGASEAGKDAGKKSGKKGKK